MHPFLNQQLGDFHRAHLLHEAEIERSSEQAFLLAVFLAAASVCYPRYCSPASSA